MVSTLSTITATDTAQTNADLRIAEGVELLGKYEGSGYKEPHFLARRADGQVIHLPRLLYLILAAVDGRRDFQGISQHVSQEVGRRLNVEQLGFLVEQRLRPLGLLRAGGAAERPAERPDPLLALKFRGALVPERVVNAIAGALQPLFWPPVVVAVLAGLAAVDGWLFFMHGIAQSSRQVIYQPLFLLLVLGLVLLTLGFAARNVALGVDTYGIGSAGLLAAWCGLLANSSFVDTLHWRHLWFVAALIWAGTALRAGYPGR